jgi:hypothetical protein
MGIAPPESDGGQGGVILHSTHCGDLFIRQS